MKLFKVWGLSFIVYFYSFSAVLATTRFEVYDIGTLGGTMSVARVLNDQGVVGGHSWLPQNTLIHGFIWTAENGIEDLGVWGSDESSAVYGINENNEIVGESMYNGGNRPVRWINGRAEALGFMPGYSLGYAYGINDNGQIIGSMSNPGFGSPQRAFLYENGRFIDLGTLGGQSSWAGGINNRGDIVGWANLSDGTYMGFIYRGQVMEALSRFDGNYSGGGAINDRREVVGDSTVATFGDVHAAYWSQRGRRDLGALPGHRFAQATSINEEGYSVGYSRPLSYQGDPRAVLWTKSGRIIDLNDKIVPGTGWVLEIASQINHFGYIAGSGIYNGKVRAFMLKPIQD